MTNWKRYVRKEGLIRFFWFHVHNNTVAWRIINARRF